MAFVPNTVVRLLNVPFESDYKNVLHYTSRANQTDTLMGMTVRTFTDFTYQRKDNIIKVPAHVDSLWNCNYVMYQNTNFNNKWFYAFIVNMEYVNDGVTNIYIKTDVYNTWFFDCTIKPSFVEREHTADDTIGANTITEGLETGSFVVNQEDHVEELNNPYIVIGTTRNPHTGIKTSGGMYGGVFSGVNYYCYNLLSNSDTATDALEYLENNGYSDSIVSIFIAPQFLCGEIGLNNTVELTLTNQSFTKTIQKPTNVDGYVPRNNKLLTYPFSFLELTNMQGSSNILKWERFYEGTLYGSTSHYGVEFKIKGTITPGCSIRCVPRFYNSKINSNSAIIDVAELAESEGINLGKYPICSWNNDVYINWLTQNSSNIENNFMRSIFNMGSNIVRGGVSGGSYGARVGGGLGAAGGALIGGVVSGANGYFDIMGQFAQIEAHSFASPVVAGNLNNGDVMYASFRNTFHFIYKSIKAEFAKSIDEFFDMYGYKTNRVKIPNRGHRSRYWFTKTINCNIDGAVPQEDLNELKAIYDNGVTFWRNPSEIDNYALSNTVIPITL